MSSPGHLSGDSMRGFARRLVEIEERDAERDREYRRRIAEAEEAEREKDAADRRDSKESEPAADEPSRDTFPLELIDRMFADRSPRERELRRRLYDESLPWAERHEVFTQLADEYTERDTLAERVEVLTDDPDRDDARSEHAVTRADRQRLRDDGLWGGTFRSGEQLQPKLDRAETARRLRLAAEEHGMSFSEFTRPASRGRQSQAEAERRTKLAQALARLHDDGASLAVLAAVTGCHVNTVSRLVQEARG